MTEHSYSAAEADNARDTLAATKDQVPGLSMFGLAGHVGNASMTRMLTVQRSPQTGVQTEYFPYLAGVVSDEVALRASPDGAHDTDKFHNLVASLRQDVHLVVEGHSGGWMKVRVESGSALDGKMNQPINAAGLTGYVSRELLQMREAGPLPTPDPAKYNSLQDFSAAWPDKVTSSEQIEKVFDGQTRQAWIVKALTAADIDPGKWKPEKGYRFNKEIFHKVYAYYSSLYLADHRLKWAAMAKLAGGEVQRGYDSNILPAEDFGKDLRSLSDDDFSVLNLAGGAYELFSETMDIRLLQMQKEIFLDLAWQHEAYREGGINAMAAAHTRNEITDEILTAWKDIDSGDASRINAGNMKLLRREQFDILQGYYKMIQDIPDNNMIPETMSEEAQSPIPGGQPFAKVVKDGDITNFDDRWKWLQKDMIPAFEKLDPATLERLVNLPLEELAKRKF
jgi:uncharacterized protein DUF2515